MLHFKSPFRVDCRFQGVWHTRMFVHGNIRLSAPAVKSLECKSRLSGVRADAPRRRHNHRPVADIQPEGPVDGFIVAVTRERTFSFVA